MAQTITASDARDVIQLIGLPPEEVLACLEELDLRADSLTASSAAPALSTAEFGQLFMRLIRRSQASLVPDPQMLDSVVALSSYRVMYVYMVHGKSLGEAIGRAASYFSRFQNERQTFALEVLDDAVFWHFDLGPIDVQRYPDRTDFNMGQLNWLPGLEGRMLALYIWHRLASWLIGNFIDVDGVHFDCPLSGSAHQHAERFRAPVYFNAERCGVAFHRRYLDFPVVQTEDTLNRMLETFPAELIEIDELATSTAARVRGLLGDDFTRRMPSLEEVASRLFTTAPTLHRRLRDEGTSFREIKDNCRRDVAIESLREGAMSGAALAEYLGFSDASAFYRAFKKWTGLTAQEFRRREA